MWRQKLNKKNWVRRGLRGSADPVQAPAEEAAALHRDDETAGERPVPHSLFIFMTAPPNREIAPNILIWTFH